MVRLYESFGTRERKDEMTEHIQVSNTPALFGTTQD